MKLTKEELKTLYIEEDLTQKEIAKKHTDINRGTVGHHLRKHNINKNDGKIKLTKEKLETLYVEKNLTGKEISNLHGNITFSGINYHLNKHNIDKSHKKKQKARIRRGRKSLIEKHVGSLENFKEIVEQADTVVQIAKEAGIKRETIYKLIDHFNLNFKTRTERLEEIDDEDLLRKMYKEKSQKQIANELGCSRKYILKLFKKYGIETDSRHAFESHTEESIRRMRRSTLKNLKKKHGKICPNYNPDACELIEQYGEKYGYNFQHAENGGEHHIKDLGYFLDGYDEKQNVVIEVDEAYHFKNGELCEKDKRRQEEIEEHLGCEFIRVKI